MTPASPTHHHRYHHQPQSSLPDHLHYPLQQELTAITMTSQPPSPQTPTQQLLQTRRQPTPIKIHTRAPVAKPSPAEEELVRRIHRKVGGPAKLSTYDDPAKVRHVVIEALALEQTNVSDASRIRKGQLSVFERRVVRTVTNRGAAVRSRMRQRKEVAQLKNELRVRDIRVRRLEDLVRALCSKYAVPLPELLRGDKGDVETEPESDSMRSTVQGKGVVGTVEPPDFALDPELFGNLVDQMISHPAWC